jgi:hypothetical protein
MLREFCVFEVTEEIFEHRMRSDLRKSDRATDSEGEKLLSETFRRVYGVVLRRSTFFKITNMGLDLKRQDKLGGESRTLLFPAYYGWIEEILLDSGNKDIKGDSHATQRRNT